MSEKSIARQQPGRVRRAKDEPSAPSSLDGDCSSHKFLVSRVEGSLQFVRQQSKSEILVEKVHAELEKLRSDFAQVRTEMLNERVIRAEHHCFRSSHESVLPAIRNVGTGSP